MMKKCEKCRYNKYKDGSCHYFNMPIRVMKNYPEKCEPILKAQGLIA